LQTPAKDNAKTFSQLVCDCRQISYLFNTAQCRKTAPAQSSIL